MAIIIRGRNKFEVYLIMFWTVGLPILLFCLGDKITEYISESLLIFLVILIYISVFFLHFIIMGWYNKLNFNNKFNVSLNQKEFNYIHKHLIAIPNSPDIEQLSKELRKALYIYLAYNKDKKKTNENFISNSIKLLKDNHLI